MARKKKKDEAAEPKATESTPLRHLAPRLRPIRLSPFKQQFRNVRDSAGFFASLKSSLDAQGHRCPECDSPMVFVARGTDGRSDSALVCSSCDYSEALVIEPQAALEKAERMSRQALQFLYIGMAIAVIASLIALFNRSSLTLLGGVLLGIILWLQAAGFRYRQWQYENMRLFEPKAPIKDWLTAEYRLFRGSTPSKDLTST